MPYKFTFDLSRISRFFFTEVARAGYEKGLHKKVGKTAQDMIKKFKISEATGLELSDAVIVLEDLVDITAKNLIARKKFTQSRKRVLFLPHCARKHMDSQCQASFDSGIPSYICHQCSSDCLVNQASRFAAKKGYDVYVVPGGSCIPKILKNNGYEGVVGVACGEETKLGERVLEEMGLPAQAVPLIKNGCANTLFSLESLQKTLQTDNSKD